MAPPLIATDGPEKFAALVGAAGALNKKGFLDKRRAIPYPGGALRETL